MAESAETDHSHFLAPGDAPVMHGGVRSDSGTEQRRGCVEVKIRGHAQNKMFINNDAFGVAAVGPASEMLVRGIEGKDHVRAVLFKASFALRTGTIGIDHTADRDDIARFVLRDCRADLRHTPHDFMTGDNRVNSGHELAPLVAHRMQIGVADAAEQDFNLHVAISWMATLDLGGGQRRCLAGSGVSLRVVRSWMHNDLISLQRFNFQLSTYCQSNAGAARTSYQPSTCLILNCSLNIFGSIFRIDAGSSTTHQRSRNSFIAAA